METRADYFAVDSAFSPQKDEALAATFCLLCAMGRFYARNQDMLTRNASRLLMLNRLACCLAVELEHSGLGIRYAPDLIHIDEQLNIGIRSRDGTGNLLALELTFTSGRPAMEHLHTLCCSGPVLQRYRLGIGMGLTRRDYRLEWISAEPELNREMTEKYNVWSREAGFLNPVY